MNEYDTHFYSGQQEGKSESDVCKELGNPKLIGKELTATSSVENAHQKVSLMNISSAIVAVMGLSLLNFFIVIIPAFFMHFARINLHHFYSSFTSCTIDVAH